MSRSPRAGVARKPSEPKGGQDGRDCSFLFTSPVMHRRCVLVQCQRPTPAAGTRFRPTAR